MFRQTQVMRKKLEKVKPEDLPPVFYVVFVNKMLYFVNKLRKIVNNFEKAPLNKKYHYLSCSKTDCSTCFTNKVSSASLIS
jgi:hypothetical protein